LRPVLLAGSSGAVAMVSIVQFRHKL